MIVREWTRCFSWSVSISALYSTAFLRDIRVPSLKIMVCLEVIFYFAAARPSGVTSDCKPHEFQEQCTLGNASWRRGNKMLAFDFTFTWFKDNLTDKSQLHIIPEENAAAFRLLGLWHHLSSNVWLISLFCWFSLM